MANTIENTVTFSGADIAVIAYRAGKTPAEKFMVGDLKKDLQRTVRESNEYNRKAFELTKDKDFKLAKAQYQEEMLSNSEISPGAGFGPINNNEGSYHNRINLLAEASALDQEINQMKEARKGLIEHANRLSEKINRIDSISHFTLGSIHTVSYSSFREKMAVRTLGRTQAKGYTRGARTVAGTLVFNVFQEHEFLKLLGKGGDNAESSDGPIDPRAAMLDQIYPFNLLLLFANEYGAYSTLHLLNIDIQSEGQEMSIDNVLTHNTMNFYATDMIPMTSLGNTFSSYDEMINGSLAEGIESSSTKSTSSIRNSMDALIKNPFSDTDEYSRLLASSRGLF